MTHHDEKPVDLLLQIESSPYRPSNTERTYLSNELHLAQEELHKLDAELAILLAKRSHVIRHIIRCRTSLAPYSKLPVELIEEIIKLSQPMVLSLPPSNGKNDFRLQITQICSSWRRVAFGIPALWNVYLDKVPGQNTMNLISSWLRQCSSTEIVLQGSPDAGTRVPTQMKLEELFVLYSCRVKTLSFLPYKTANLCFFPWDVLTSLSLRLNHWTPTLNKGACFDAPYLRDLVVNEVASSHGLNIFIFLPQLPLEQLSGLTLDGALTMAHIYEVLPHCPSLERCRLETIVSDSVETHFNAPLNLPRLQLLWIKFRKRRLFDNLFIFNVPNLSSFSISHPPDESRFLETFTKFVGTFRNTLLEFRITQTETSSSQASIEGIVEGFTSMTHLRIEEYRIPPVTLGKIGVGELLPNLKVLRFTVHDRKDVEGIVHLLMPQQPSRTSQLQNLYIQNKEWYPLPHYLEKLRSQGIDVSLESDLDTKYWQFAVR